MAKVIQVDELRVIAPTYQNCDARIQIFYDETNNFRKFRLDEMGLNAPNDPFVLGGIALGEGKFLEGWVDLRKAIGAQATDLKLKHIAKGDFEATLAERRLSLVLQWLIDTGTMTHYNVLDPLYFAILDIIDSLQADDRFDIDPVHQELKGELHYAVLQDLPAFLKLMHGYGFPDVPREKACEFLNDVDRFVRSRVPEDRNAATFLLKQTLRKASRVRDLELAFLHDNESGELITNLAHWFMHSVYTFKNAIHVFDEETEVQKYLGKFDIYDGNRRVAYSFCNSKASVGVQASDIVAGLFGRYFRYLNAHSIRELVTREKDYTDIQKENLARLRMIVQRSMAFSWGLFFELLPMDTRFKNEAFLRQGEIPPFMWDL